jgi:hypothetical protein
MIAHMNDVQVVLKALHLAACDTTLKTLDPDGDRSIALWVASLAVSAPDESLDITWPALVTLSREYVGFAEVIRADHHEVTSPDQIDCITKEGRP